MGKTILIVEDEQNIVDILSFNLSREGYDTLEAYDGITGLQLALENNPDLILLDLMLPGMNGFDVCRKVREAGLSTPKQSGVLRAISGGPVYVSDGIGQTSAANIIPVVGKDGDICRLDNAALPTVDCIYSDSRKNGKLLKAYNNSADNIALAVFNISKEAISESITLDVVPIIDADKEYIAYEYFTKKFTRVNKDTVIDASLDVAGVLSYSLYPIMNGDDGEYIVLGDCDRYVGIATKEKKTVYVSELV